MLSKDEKNLCFKSFVSLFCQIIYSINYFSNVYSNTFFYASQHEYPNFSDQLQRLKIGKLNKESIRHNVNKGSMTNLINYFHAVISVHDFETFIDLNRFVVLLPHCRSRDGKLGSSFFSNWSYSRWHEFFTSKRKKDRLS